MSSCGPSWNYLNKRDCPVAGSTGGTRFLTDDGRVVRRGRGHPGSALQAWQIRAGPGGTAFQSRGVSPGRTRSTRCAGDARAACPLPSRRPRSLPWVTTQVSLIDARKTAGAKPFQPCARTSAASPRSPAQPRDDAFSANRSLPAQEQPASVLPRQSSLATTARSPSRNSHPVRQLPC